MRLTKTCNTNPVLKYIRVALSLFIIGLGIYYHNWLGALGLLTLYTALTGQCSLSLTFDKKTEFKLKDRDKEEEE
jgi:hypothetical protein